MIHFLAHRLHFLLCLQWGGPSLGLPHLPYYRDGPALNTVNGCENTQAHDLLMHYIRYTVYNKKKQPAEYCYRYYITIYKHHYGADVYR